MPVPATCPAPKGFGVGAGLDRLENVLKVDADVGGVSGGDTTDTLRYLGGDEGANHYAKEVAGGGVTEV